MRAILSCYPSSSWPRNYHAPSEIVSLDWKHVDLKKRIAYLPETKNGVSRGVPLSSVSRILSNELSLPSTFFFLQYRG